MHGMFVGMDVAIPPPSSLPSAYSGKHKGEDRPLYTARSTEGKNDRVREIKKFSFWAPEKES